MLLEKYLHLKKKNVDLVISNDLHAKCFSRTKRKVYFCFRKILIKPRVACKVP